MIVPNWTPVGRLMHFSWLTTSGRAIPVYTVGWRIIGNADHWTTRFLRFKEGQLNDMRGGAQVLNRAIQELLTHLTFDARHTGLTTALSSGNTQADPKSVLFRVGKWLAEQNNLEWLPSLFTKEAHQSLHNLPVGADRDAEVKDKYSCGRARGIRQLIILDDFVTRGATLGDMTRAFKVSNPGTNVVGLALAKNEKATFAASHGVIVDNSHIPAEWDELWEQAKQKK